MEHKTTFRSFVLDRYGSRLPNYSIQSAFSYTISSILEDSTFPDDETDGLEVKNYIRQKQMEKEVYNRTEKALCFNRAVVYHFESLWKEYKEYIRS